MEKARLLNGDGPEITIPDWVDKPKPDPDEWIDWFEQQSREAQRVIVAHLLDAEARGL